MNGGTRAAAFAAALFFAVAAPAAGDSVAYIESHNLWLASPDGAYRLQVTADGTETNGYTFPSQGLDGKTVVAHHTQFDNSRRPTLHLFGPDATFRTANVMPVYSGANVPVYPIGLDMDWKSEAVAYGYSYCSFACQSVHRGYWLTFSDNQGLYPSNPQGQSDAYFPTFFGTRVVSSDSGGSIFVQPDVPEAPFTDGYQGWLSSAALFLSRAEVSPKGHLVAVEWSHREQEASGIAVGRHQGTVPSDVQDLCELPVAANSSSVTFSPDGRHIAWSDAQGVKVAGVPNLAAASETCTLSSPPLVISATGRSPSFGGGDVAAILESRKPPAQAPADQTSAGQQPTGEPGQPGSEQPKRAAPAQIRPVAPRSVTSKSFARGLRLTIRAPAVGRVSASASVTAAVARRAGLRRGRLRSAGLVAFSSARGVSSSRRVVVARGSTTASSARSVTLRLRPTPVARRAARRLRGAVLKVAVSQRTRRATATIKVR